MAHCACFLDPFAQQLGMDGVILLAFILGLPANEIVVPIMIMAYLSTGTLTEMNNLAMLRQLLVENGWTWATAVSVMLFFFDALALFDYLSYHSQRDPEYQVDGNIFLVPTVMGMAVCFFVPSSGTAIWIK